jgi:hypothetical protein
MGGVGTFPMDMDTFGRPSRGTRFLCLLLSSGGDGQGSWGRLVPGPVSLGPQGPVKHP